MAFVILISLILYDVIVSSNTTHFVQDFGDGGAFPEIPVAQYPLNMGREGKESTSNALAVQLDSQGKIKYDILARQGHSKDKVIHLILKYILWLKFSLDHFKDLCELLQILHILMKQDTWHFGFEYYNIEVLLTLFHLKAHCA